MNSLGWQRHTSSTGKGLVSCKWPVKESIKHGLQHTPSICRLLPQSRGEAPVPPWWPLCTQALPAGLQVDGGDPRAGPKPSCQPRIREPWLEKLWQVPSGLWEVDGSRGAVPCRTTGSPSARKGRGNGQQGLSPPLPLWELWWGPTWGLIPGFKLLGFSSKTYLGPTNQVKCWNM